MRNRFRYLVIALVLGLLINLAAVVPIQAQATPVIQLSAYTGPVGTSLTVTAANFSGNETVTIYFDSSLVVSSFGLSILQTSFTQTFTVPEYPAGNHIVTVNATSTGTKTANFTVTPSLTLSKTSGEAGSALTVYGHGFAAGELNIITRFNGSTGQAVGTTQTASALGQWSNTFNIPSVNPGSYTIYAVGASNNASVSFTVITSPKITINQTSGTVGSQVTVSGVGFAANESGIKVTFDDNKVSGTANASASGTWSLTFNVPLVAAGTYTIDAYGDTTAKTSVADLNFTITPEITINPGSGNQGSTVTVEGNGFAANERNIFITWDNADISTATQADSNGTWSNTFTVPVSSGGSHSIGARGSTTSASSVPKGSFRVGSGISISKTSGPAGTSVTVSGSGFAASEKGVTVYIDNTAIGSSPNVDAQGNWKSTFNIPNLAGGDHTITAKGTVTPSATAGSVTFTVTPTVKAPDKISGPAGTTITLEGNGFLAGETGITVTYDGSKLGSPVTADKNGYWKATFTIPSSSSGTHTIQVNSASATDISLGDFSFKVSSVISISPSQGNIGSSVNITGSGFAPNSSLTFLYDDAELSVNVTTSDTGTFTKSITISKSTGGIHTISVIDSQNNRASATFTMESIAPAIPEPVSPEDGTKMGFFGGAVPSFQWEKVSDPSGVTYSLQVDTSDDFSDPIINKTGLENNKYTVNNNDALPRGEYYWRVKAVDAAGNESEWSSPMLLVSGSMNPAVFIIIIIAVVAALAAAFYFLLLPRIKKSKVKQPAAGAASPEIVIPEVVNAEYRMLETEKKSLPWKLALPQAPQAAKGPKSLSSEDQARLKAIIEFAKSLPLVEPGANTQWLIELAESGGSQNTTPIQSQLLKGEAQVHYEPAWMRHPTYMDLQSLLEGQPILQDLNSYVDSINHSAMDAAMILQDIYRDSTSELGQDIFVENGWDYISAVYSDAFGWFQGKNLREPSERDYSIKAEPLSNGASTFTLSGESNSPFPGKLIQVTDEKQAVQLRALHLKLRRTYRSNERTRSLVSMIMQLEVQRGRLINAFNQFNRLNPA